MKDKIKEAFEKLFNSKAIVTNYVSFQQKKKVYFQITLDESDNSNKENTLEKVTLRGFDDIYFALKFDNTYFLHRKFDSEKNENDYSDSLIIDKTIYKACDYIVWVNFEGRNLLLIIELKSKDFENKSIKLKFRNTIAFIEYLKLISESFRTISESGNFHIILLLINSKTVSKVIPKNDFGFYKKGLRNDEIWNIKSDFEQILKIENL